MIIEDMGKGAWNVPEASQGWESLRNWGRHCSIRWPDSSLHNTGKLTTIQVSIVFPVFFPQLLDF